MANLKVAEFNIFWFIETESFISDESSKFRVVYNFSTLARLHLPSQNF